MIRLLYLGLLLFTRLSLESDFYQIMRPTMLYQQRTRDVQLLKKLGKSIVFNREGSVFSRKSRRTYLDLFDCHVSDLRLLSEYEVVKGALFNR